MTIHQLPRREATAAPDAYLGFIDEMRQSAMRHGLTWEIALDARGLPKPAEDWDLRVLTGSHARTATKLGGFALNTEVRDAALAQGMNSADLPQVAVLPAAVQDFVKAMVVEGCSRGRRESGVRDVATIVKKFFSTTNKAPWELSTEDFDRARSLLPGARALPAIARLAKLLNEHLLSRHLPISFRNARRNPTVLANGLNERAKGDKLPEREALFELVRIIFQVEPRGHQDFIRFAALRLMVLTGLRINEVMMLPVDCLKWEDHVDIVTGRPAEAVGGRSRSLALRYFAEKQADGSPGVLVERQQWVPEKFQAHIDEAVKGVLEATSRLRTVLLDQHRDPSYSGKSDVRSFKTLSGRTLSTADLLLLVHTKGRSHLSPEIDPSCAISPLAPNTLYSFIARRRAGAKNVQDTIFQFYGGCEETRQYSLKPHSLRHLMNTELFRLGVPDTVITHQFGRKTVAQSYEYDHRTLLERLRDVQLPEVASTAIKSGSTHELVAKMVVSGVAASSHVGKTFKSIQAEHGDAAAFDYLQASTDGFHVTPYGLCLNSFSVNPCARHLKCFDNCKHFAASGRKEHVVSLVDLRKKLAAMREVACSRPALTVGRKNQIAHAETLLAGVDRALAAQPNEPVFPEGYDHSQIRTDLFK